MRGGGGRLRLHQDYVYDSDSDDGSEAPDATPPPPLRRLLLHLLVSFFFPRTVSSASSFEAELVGGGVAAGNYPALAAPLPAPIRPRRRLPPWAAGGFASTTAAAIASVAEYFYEVTWVDASTAARPTGSRSRPVATSRTRRTAAPLVRSPYLIG